MQIHYNRAAEAEENHQKAIADAEAEHSKKTMQEAEAKKIAKERVLSHLLNNDTKLTI